MIPNNIITPDVINTILTDKSVRTLITRESHYWFFHLYFHEHVQYPTAEFQKEMFRITEDEALKMAVIVAFRGSAKSTIMTMSYPLWAVLGKQQKKCVVIISQTQQQVRTHFANIKRILEGNELLRRDLGPFEEESDEWGSYSLVIPRFNARLVAASSEQSIRGIRHGAYRPDLIICDDVEDGNSVKTKESRDKAYSWLKGEVIPLGDKSTKVIMVGNLLHEDSLLMRIKKEIDFSPAITNKVFREYPLIDEQQNILWPGKFKDLQEVEEARSFISNDKAWQREYMLKIIAYEDQIVQPEWIQYYDTLPEDTDDYKRTITTVDLAISSSSSADFTAILTAHVFGSNENKKIYILPHPINQRLDAPRTLELIKEISEQKFYNGRGPEVFIEDVGYQLSVIQQLTVQGVDVEGFKVHGQDKRARLNSVTQLIKLGQVVFPKQGTEELIQQLLYFGVEKNDDLVDAFSMLLIKVIEDDRPEPQILSPEFCALLRGGGDSYYSENAYWF